MSDVTDLFQSEAFRVLSVSRLVCGVGQVLNQILKDLFIYSEQWGFWLKCLTNDFFVIFAAGCGSLFADRW